MKLPRNTLKQTTSFIFKLIPKLLYFSLLFVFVWGCSNSDPLDIDVGLKGYKDRTIEINGVQLSTIQDDAVRTDNIDFQVLGSINDSVFGITKSNVYTQVGIDGTVKIAANAILDSMVLSIRNLGAYGNRKSPQKYFVYRLDEAMLDTAKYYSNSQLAYSTKIGEFETDAYNKLGAFLRIRVDKLFSETDIFLGKEYKSSGDFQEVLKGLVVVSALDMQENEGCLAYFNFLDPSSGLYAYFHYLEVAGGELVPRYTSAKFQFQSETTTFTSLSYDWTGRRVESSLSPDSNDAYYAFSKALGAVSAKIKLPMFKDFKDSGQVAFHKVELVLPCALEYHNPNFLPLSLMDLKALNSDGGFSNIADAIQPYWTRAYNYQGNSIVFNITAHAQGLVNSYKKNSNFVDNGLVVKTIKDNPIGFTAGRFVFKGGRKDKLPNGAYIRIHYSKIDTN